MTRETKIGLLVGLAFIIVIGILLSDHLTNSTEPMPAMLGQAGENARQAVATPGTVAPPINVISPVNMQPKNPVPTQVELQRPNPVQIVQVGGPTNPNNGPSNNTQSNDNNAMPPITRQTAPESNNVIPPAAEAQATNDTPNVSRTPAGVSPVLLGAANQGGEPLVALNGQNLSNKAANVPTNPQPRNVKDAKETVVREYKAELSDTLGKIAARTMGANTKANRDAIVAANPSLKADPNLIIAGRTYVIPGAATSSEPTKVVPVTPTAVLANNTNPPTREREVGEYFYTVKSSDSLWRIATEQCGRGSAVAAIKELNKDLLKGSETVHPGMKLRLPSRPVASAN